MVSKMKKGQVEMTFNWIYVLIAGAVILLFFVTIVVKQKNVSEDKLAGDVIRIMESIFTGAQVSEQTKNVVKTGGLADKELFFKCEEGVGEYGITGFSARIQNSLDPVFSPPTIRNPTLVLWSMPYKLPFKVTDFLFITSKNTKYYVMGDGNGFREEFTQGALDDDKDLSLSVEEITSLDEILATGSNVRVRIIDLDGSFSASVIPASLSRHDDDDVSAISFLPNRQMVFYQKQGSSWQRLNQQPINLISLDGSSTGVSGKFDAAKYGAIFSENPVNYQCNMQKAFRRLNLVSQVYKSKAEELSEYYAGLQPHIQECETALTADANGYILENIDLQVARAGICAKIPDDLDCINMIRSAQIIKDRNLDLENSCLVLLY
jgi:hypothetical protein